MYRRPAQCSPLVRSKTAGGCVTARSSAIEGGDERIDAVTDLGLWHAQVFEDGVALGTGGGRLRDRGGELLGVETQVGRDARRPVATQASVELLQRRAAAQEAREERPDGDLGPVGPGPRVERFD